ncbi:hypothetical protein ACFFHM_06670 [Halalkalibacter kiskunsagensis]|uniref:Uncharacterized protein n=1 Tax=Halalkalibacter kiskunsagensis TaxID=1548599 RepID=A0ABV6KA80_9BACI
MIKQLFVLFLAISMFVTVWGLVILQFPSSKEKEIPSLQYVEASTIAFELQNEKKRVEEKSEKVEHEVTGQKNMIHQNNQNQIINLQDFDFSDVSTSDGVPVEAILIKLNLK